MASHRILGLDIGASTVKIAEFAALKSGGLQLKNFGVGALETDLAEGDASALIVTTIKEVLRERQIQAGPVILSVSGQSVFSRFVRLPPVDKDKVYQIISYEAQQNVPFPIEEVVWDYQLIGRGEGELDVMLAAIKSDIIVGLTDAVEQAGLQIDIVDVAPMALYNAVRYNYGGLTGCTLVIDIGARSTDLIFIESGRVFIRSVPVAGNAITQQIMREFELSFADAEEMKRAHSYVSFGGAYEAPKSEVSDKVSKIVRSVMTRMHAEINRSINFYRTQQNGQQPSLALLTGGGSVIPYTDNFLKEKLRMDVDYLNPFVNVPVSQGIASEDIGKTAQLLGQVVGLALRKVHSCPIEINLLPAKVVQDKAFRRKEPVLLLSGFSLVLAVLVWFLAFVKLTGVARASAEKVTVKVNALAKDEAPLKQLEGQIADYQGKIDKLYEVTDKRTVWIDLLRGVRGALPESLWLTSLTPVRKTDSDAALVKTYSEAEKSAPAGSVIRLEVSGFGFIDEVPNADMILQFRDKLRESPLFGDQTKIVHQPTPAAGDLLREFKLQLPLEKPILP
jgi:type IV pilus assembly protein PilM